MTDTRIYRTELEQPSACGGRWGLYVDGRLIARTDRALAYEHKDQLHNFTASPPVLLDALHTLFKAAPPAPRGALRLMQPQALARGVRPPADPRAAAACPR